jgi:hypothetical protein
MIIHKPNPRDGVLKFVPGARMSSGRISTPRSRRPESRMIEAMRLAST